MCSARDMTGRVVDTLKSTLATVPHNFPPRVINISEDMVQPTDRQSVMAISTEWMYDAFEDLPQLRLRKRNMISIDRRTITPMIWEVPLLAYASVYNDAIYPHVKQTEAMYVYTSGRTSLSCLLGTILDDLSPPPWFTSRGKFERLTTLHLVRFMLKEAAD